MEVKKGYKRTEIGVIPADWEAVPLGRLAGCFSGGTPSTVNPRYYGGEIAWITSSDLNKRRIHGVRGRITAEGLANSSAKLVDKGTLLLAMYGATAGVCAVSEIQAAINQAVLAIVPRSASTEFLFQQLLLLKERYIRSYTQGGQPNFSAEIVKSFLVSLPPLAEQKAIAEALSDVDDLIASLERLIAKKRDIKAATMGQLLTGRTRLPGFTGEWARKRLGEIADIISGGTPRTNEPSYWNGGIKWCTPSDITRCARRYLTDTERTISRSGLKESGAALLPVGALLLCSRATIGELKIAGTPISTNQGFKSLVCRPGTSNEFLYYKLLTMKQQMVERAFGSTFLEISTRNVFALEVAAPPIEEQTAIAAVLSDMDAEIEALESRLAKTRMLKQGMMQELLTGRTRLV